MLAGLAFLIIVLAVEFHTISNVSKAAYTFCCNNKSVDLIHVAGVSSTWNTFFFRLFEEHLFH